VSEEESRLIRRAKERDPAALTEIYELHQPTIYRYILHRVDDVATAEDLTAEVFVRMVAEIGRFTSRGRPLLAWLYTIARNLVTDHYRRGGKLPQVALDEQLMSSIADPDDRIQRWLVREQLYGALAYLTDEQYEVVFLRFIEGLDNETVAQLLGKSVRAVKSLQYRGMITLRRVLKRNGY